MTLTVLGIGTAVPRFSITQDEAARLSATFSGGAKKERVLRTVYSRSGVDTRHSVLLGPGDNGERVAQTFYAPSTGDADGGPTTADRMLVFEREAPPLGEQASRAALEEAGVPPESITHLITVSCTGFFAPGLDASLVSRLGLSRGVERTHVGFMGCHGAMNALRVASGFTAAEPEALVLITSVELCTLHFQYGWDRDQVVTNALFADGAAALVGGGSPAKDAGSPNPSSSSSSRPNPRPNPSDPWTVTACGTHLLPDCAEDMTWRIGSHGFHMTLTSRVPELINTQVGPWLDEWLGNLGLDRSQVGSWAVHPGGPRILSAVEDALDLDAEALDGSREVLARRGNMSSATVLFILQNARARDLPRPCVALAFGPGLVVEAALLR